MNKYRVLSRIGFGTFGEVFRAKDLSTGEIVALKTVVRNKNQKSETTNFQRELNSLLHLNHENVIALIDNFKYKHRHVFSFEFSRTDLGRVLKKLTYPLSEAQIKGLSLMILRGINHCHENKVVHRDIKPSNILITSDGVAKIADFGMSRFLPFPPRSTAPTTSSSSSASSSSSSSSAAKPSSIPLSHKVVTRFYRCPELLYGAREYDYGVDVWAYGCIVAELFTQCPLFQAESDIQQLIKVIATLGTPSDAVWPEMHTLPDYGKILFPQLPGVPLESLIPSASVPAIRFIKRMLVYSASKRATAAELLDDEWFYTRPLPATDQIFPLTVLS